MAQFKLRARITELYEPLMHHNLFCFVLYVAAAVNTQSDFHSFYTRIRHFGLPQETHTRMICHVQKIHKRHDMALKDKLERTQFD